MLVKLLNPVGRMEKVREEDVQHYLELGYNYILQPVREPETVELMSPAGKVVVAKKDVNDYLQKEGWSLLVEEIPTEDETPEPPVGDEISETPETPVEDQIPVLSTDEAPVEESEMVEADAETANDIPDGAEEAEETTE